MVTAGVDEYVPPWTMITSPLAEASDAEATSTKGHPTGHTLIVAEKHTERERPPADDVNTWMIRSDSSIFSLVAVIIDVDRAVRSSATTIKEGGGSYPRQRLWRCRVAPTRERGPVFWPCRG